MAEAPRSPSSRRPRPPPIGPSGMSATRLSVPKSGDKDMLLPPSVADAGISAGMHTRRVHTPVELLKRPLRLSEVCSAASVLGLDLFNHAKLWWVVEEFLVAPLPEGWEECYDRASDSAYYYNLSDDSSSWEHPNADYYRSLVTGRRAVLKSIVTDAMEELSVPPTSRVKRGAPRDLSADSSVIKGDRPALATGNGVDIDATAFIELARYLGVKEEEHALMSVVCEYLDHINCGHLPEGWACYQASGGELYYFNALTQVSSYDHPLVKPFREKVNAERDRLLISGAGVVGSVLDHWFVMATTAGRIYYYNVSTDRSRWEPPDLTERFAPNVQRVLRGFLGRARFRLFRKRMALLAKEGEYARRYRRSHREVMGEGMALDRVSFDADGNIRIAERRDGDDLEARRWRMEKRQFELKDAIVAWLRVKGDVSSWIALDHEEAMTYLEEASAIGLDDPADPFNVAGHVVVGELRNKLREYADLQQRLVAEEEDRKRQLREEREDREREGAIMELRDVSALLSELSPAGMEEEHQSVEEAVQVLLFLIERKEDPVVVWERLTEIRTSLTSLQSKRTRIDKEQRRRRAEDARTRARKEERRLAEEREAAERAARRAREREEAERQRHEHRQQREAESAAIRNELESIRSKQLERASREEEVAAEHRRSGMWVSELFDSLEASGIVDSIHHAEDGDIIARLSPSATSRPRSHAIRYRPGSFVEADREFAPDHRRGRSGARYPGFDDLHRKPLALGRSSAAAGRPPSPPDHAAEKLIQLAKLEVRTYLGPVWLAVQQDNLHMVQNFFLTAPDDSLLRERSWKDGNGGRTLLHSAAWCGSIKVARYLLLLGADVNALDSPVSQTTPLMEAARRGHRQLCRLLVDNGADVLAQNHCGDTACHIAARAGHAATLSAVLESSEKRRTGNCARALAVRNDRGRTIEQLPHLSDGVQDAASRQRVLADKREAARRRRAARARKSLLKDDKHVHLSELLTVRYDMRPKELGRELWKPVTHL